MSTKKTFAQRAKSIQNRYPYADRVRADRQARDSELMNLFLEQEQYKLDNGIPGPQDNQFDPGGWSTGESWSRYPEHLKEFLETPKKEETSKKTDYSKMSSLMNIGAGVVPALGNLTNMLSMPRTRRVTPHLINPTFSFRGTDLTPYMTALDNQLASTRYGFMQSGADFDTVTAGLSKMNSQFAQARGQLTLEQTRLDQAEAARGDEIMNAAATENAKTINAANFAYEQNRREDEQLKRDYLAGLSENISAIFQDEADRYLAEGLAPTMTATEVWSNLLKMNG